MPTGYTAEIYEGKNPSLRDFILTCVRGMGVAITLRDEPLSTPIPRHFEPETFHVDRLAEAQRRYAGLLHLTDEECAVRAKAQFDGAVAAKAEAKARYERLSKDYKAMIHQVSTWECPESLSSLKQFMLDQLHESLKHDCHDPDAPNSYYATPQLKSAMEWRAEAIEKAGKDIDYHARGQREADERIAGRNSYLDDLFGALPDD